MIGHLTEAECREFLKNQVVGRLGCYQPGKPYIVPVNFLFDGISIIAHSQEGTKIKMMRLHPQVCFETDEMKSLRQWKSVIAWGRYREIDDEREKWEALHAFVDRMMYVKISESAKPPELSAQREHPRSGQMTTIVYKIDVDILTGRYEVEEN